MQGTGNWDSLCFYCIHKKLFQSVPEFGNLDDGDDDYENKYLLAGLKLEIESRGLQRFVHRSEIELFNSIALVESNYLNAKHLADWLETKVPIEEIEDWIQRSTSHTLALSWAKAGIDLSDAQEWVNWGASPTAVRKLKKAIGWEPYYNNMPPTILWSDYGFTLEDAMRLEHAGCEADCMEGWGSLGLTTMQIIDLRKQILLAYESSPDRFTAIFDIHLEHSTHHFVRPASKFWDAIMDSLEGIREAGLPLVLENVLTYGPLSGEEILAVIDSSEDRSVALPLAQEGLNASEISVAARFIEMGFAEHQAITFANNGANEKDASVLMENKELTDVIDSFLWKIRPLTFHDALEWAKIDLEPEFVKRLVVSGVERKRFKSWKSKGYSLYSMLDFITAGWSEKSAIPWVQSRIPFPDAVLWAELNVKPEMALNWRANGFDPQIAGEWLKSGVRDPQIANRRRSAGIRPT